MVGRCVMGRKPATIMRSRWLFPLAMMRITTFGSRLVGPWRARISDVYILRGESVIATAASSSDPEVAIIPALAGEYIVRVVPFAPAGQSITGNINLTEVTQGPPPSAGIAPRYSVFNPPSGLGQSAGEPSIGANWRTDKVLFQAVLETLRVSFDDCASPAVAA